MRFFSEDDWRAKGIQSVGLRFLYERWAELLDNGVPVSHRAPIAGAVEILREWVSLDDSLRLNPFSKSSLSAVEQEAFGVEVKPYGRVPGTLDIDPLVPELVGPLLAQRSKRTRHYAAGGAPPSVEEQRSSVSARLLLHQLKARYIPRLCEAIAEAASDEAGPDLTKLDSLVTGFVSELLARGHAESFLRTHLRILEAKGAVVEHERDRLRTFLERLTQEPGPVAVFFRVQGSNELWENWPADFTPAEEIPAGPVGIEGAERRELEEWKEFAKPADGTRFVHVRVDAAFDHHAASRTALQVLQRNVDLAFAGAPVSEPKILQCATLRGEPPPRVAITDDRALQLKSVPARRSARASDDERIRFLGMLEPSRAETATIRRITGALRYYRISIGQPWMESSFTNLWTALEVLAHQGYDDNVIERVVRSVVPLLASYKASDLADDLLGYLLGCRVFRIEGFRESFADVYAVNQIDSALLLGVLSNRRRSEELCRLVGARSPLVCRRISKFHETVRTGKSLADAVYGTARRVEWQVRRLYRLRNEMVHGAAVALNSERLLHHLQMYVYTTILTHGQLLAADNGIATIEASVGAVDTAFHAWLEDVRSMKDVRDLQPEQWRKLYRPAFSQLM